MLLSLLAGVEGLPALDGHVASDDGPREYHPENYRQLRATLLQRSSNIVELRDLPADHFVWSDELATAFSAVLDATSDREFEDSRGTGLRWHHALEDHKNDYRADIAECKNVAYCNGVRKDGHALRTGKAQQRIQRWQEAQQEIEKAHPSWSNTKIAQEIRKDLPADEKRSVDRIRKNLERKVAPK